MGKGKERANLDIDGISSRQLFPVFSPAAMRGPCRPSLWARRRPFSLGDRLVFECVLSLRERMVLSVSTNAKTRKMMEEENIIILMICRRILSSTGNEHQILPFVEREKKTVVCTSFDIIGTVLQAQGKS